MAFERNQLSTIRGAPAGLYSFWGNRLVPLVLRHANSPAHPWFFDGWRMVNTGQCYAWAAPGWPSLLASGTLLQIPWLVNPLIGALTLLSAYSLGRLVYNGSVALLVAFCRFFSPFPLLHSVSYFAHPNSLLGITLFVFCCARETELQTNHEFLWVNLCSSMYFLIRSFDQVVGFCLLGAYLLLLVLLSNGLCCTFVSFISGPGMARATTMPTFFARPVGGRRAMVMLDRLKRCWPTGEGIGLAAAALAICSALSVFWAFQ
jgi:hypothetical protein